MGKYFGTDGIRGLANLDITPEFAMKTARAIGHVLKGQKVGKPVILIGRDPRLSGDMIEAAMIAGFTSMGCDVVIAGVIPTPAAPVLMKILQLDFSVIISASHNPMPDNGIKCFNSRGYKLFENEEAEIEQVLDNTDFDKLERLTGQEMGRVMPLPDAVQRYRFYVQSRAGANLKGLSVLMDCANGATYAAAPEIFSSLGVEVMSINDHPDGININENCGATHPELLSSFVRAGSFDAGLAFDGDGDRLIAVDEKGEAVDGDFMMNIFAKRMKSRATLRNNTLVTTVMSNVGLEMSLKDAGIEMIRAGVGDRNVLKHMLETGAAVGGEQSGHIIFSADSTTGDGIITAMHLLTIMKETGKKLSELRSEMKKCPQVLKNVKVKDKNVILESAEYKAFIEKTKSETKEGYRVLIRPSGTEPLIRVMAEGPDRESTEKMVDELCEKVERMSGETVAL